MTSENRLTGAYLAVALVALFGGAGGVVADVIFRLATGR